jgi:pimeloyl-ACP methyl ester carboxylesterase
MLPPEVQHKTVHSFDGTSISYQVTGDGPAVVLANGLGGTYAAWRHQYALFRERYKVISWDYRGLFRSGRPARLNTLALSEQYRDLEVILEAEGVERALFMGWSMGVQFNFEFYRHHPGRFAGLVVLNGVAGRPFDTAFGLAFVRTLIPIAVQLMKRGAPVISSGSQIVTRWSGLIPMLQRIGMVASTLDIDVFHDLAREYATLDFEAYGETLRYLGAHDASDLLHRVHLPTLVIAGSKDVFTPIATAVEMVDSLPNAELSVIEGGTHYAAVEYPREVNEQIRAFVKRLGYGTLP